MLVARARTTGTLMWSASDAPRVPAPSRQEPIDFVLLAEYLAALAYPARLELLEALRTPRTLGEIKLAPHRAAPGSAPAKSAARPTVLAHLNKLVEADLIRAEKVPQAGREVPCYVVNPQKLYVLTEELRRITVQHAGRGPAGDVTGTLAGAPRRQAAKGPRLVLVHGAYEGKSFPLEGASAVDGQWVIGRKRGLAVSLDYDPFVSLENAVVSRRDDGRFVLTDLRESKNGTWVNWAPLPKGGSHALEPADVIGVGRSLLNFTPG